MTLAQPTMAKVAGSVILWGLIVFAVLVTESAVAG